MKYFFILLTLASTMLFANSYESMDSDTKAVLDLITNDELSTAFETIEKIKEKKYPISIYDTLVSALYYKIIEEYRTRDFENDFNNHVKNAVSLLENEDKDKEQGAEYKAKRLQFLGSAYGYRGMYRTLSGLWASAFFDGKRAAGVLEESLVLNPKLIDNKAGIGTYLYWRSAKAGMVKYLLFWGDKKKEGIEGLKEAISKGTIVKQWALGGLLRVYIEEKNWKEALKYADKILKDFPNDVGTLRRKAMLVYLEGDKEASLKILKEKLLPIFKNKDNSVLYGDKKLNTANAQLEMLYHILKINAELGSKLLSEEEIANYKEEAKKLEKRRTESFHNIKSI